mmetsp:Transcript_60315/g.152718  ORF Transcript_60315/g.152718 Transcript_60315/m.152718 type:complete len:218 (-) Transcript_60315:1003-1656(-)
MHLLVILHHQSVLARDVEDSECITDRVCGFAPGQELDQFHDHAHGRLLHACPCDVQLGGEIGKSPRDVQGGEDTKPLTNRIFDNQVMARMMRLCSAQHKRGCFGQWRRWQNLQKRRLDAGHPALDNVASLPALNICMDNVIFSEQATSKTLVTYLHYRRGAGRSGEDVRNFTKGGTFGAGPCQALILDQNLRHCGAFPQRHGAQKRCIRPCAEQDLQ